MEKKGLQNEELLSDIKQRGRGALTPKNDYGLIVVRRGDDKSGLVTGFLDIPKYNEDEIIKSVDIEIDELLPAQTPDLPDTVLRTIYDEAIIEIDDLTQQVETLSNEVGELNANISSLQITTQSLREENDRLRITNATTENQLQSMQDSFSEQTLKLQNAIQNSIQEAVQRVSLTARNESLSQEIDSLREQLYGRQAQIDIGAQVATDFSVRVLGVEDSSLAESLVYRNPANDRGRKWINGPEVEFTNFTDSPVSIRFELRDDPNLVFEPPNRTIPAGETIKIDFDDYVNTGWASDKRPKNSFGFGGDKQYENILRIKSDKSVLEIGLVLQKQRGSRWR